MSAESESGQSPDDRLDEFEKLWQSGTMPDLARFLAESGSLAEQSQFVGDLVELDCDYRWRQSRTQDDAAPATDQTSGLPNAPVVADYCRHLELSPDAKLLERLAVAEYRIRNRHREPTLMQQVVDDSSDVIPEEIANALIRQYDQQTLHDTEVPSKTGSRSRYIGPYKILQKIAEGGMGAVYMAEQEQPIRRRVALKEIRAGHDSEQIIARFEAERQALAMMDHPNIARIFDAGTSTAGTPYFVMELVKGIPLTQYCDNNRLTIRERLELFIPVCRAVQHAHLKGIIHRDLKPSNVLVALHDGEPVPKVIDFGLAKATEHQTKLTDRTMFTEFGQVVGTLQYMSPEQAEMNQLDVDTRTDVYSLGVMLYELLTGSTPLDRATVRGHALLAVLDLIREVDPPRPSTRLSESGDAISGVSDQRKIEPSRLQQILKGELDWVVMRSLEKDRTHRYETALAFADDIRRFLDDEPVTAKPPAFTYQLTKAYRRHRAIVLFGFALLTSLILGLVGTGTMWARAKKEAGQKQIEATKAESARRIEAETKELYRLQRDKAEAALARLTFRQAMDRYAAERINEASQLLETIKPDQRHLEWYIAKNQLDTSLFTLRGHTMAVTDFAISADGSHIVSAGREAILWDARTGTKLRTLADGDSDEFVALCVDFDPVTDAIVCGGRAWKKEVTSPSGKVKHSWKKPREIAELRRWTIEGQPLPAPELTLRQSADSAIISVDVSDDGDWVAMGLTNGRVYVSGKDSPTTLTECLRPRARLNSAHFVAVDDVHFADGGRYLASVDADGGVRVWETETAEEQTGMFRAYPGAKLRAFGDGDLGTLRIGAYNSASVGTDNGHVEIWDPDFQTIDVPHDAADSPLPAPQPDGPPLFTFPDLRDAQTTGHRVHSLSAHRAGTTALATSTDSTLLATGDHDGLVKLWELRSGQLWTTLTGHTAAVTKVLINEARATVVAGSADGTLKIWLQQEFPGEPDTAVQIASGDEYLPDYAISPNGLFVAATSLKSIDIWDLDGRHLRSLSPPPNLPGELDWSRIRFAPDSESLAAIRGDECRVWSVTGNEDPVILRGARGQYIYDAEFSSTGSVLATCGGDSTIRLWDAKTGTLLRTLRGHRDHVVAVDFSRDNRHIVSSSEDGTVRVWNTIRGKVQQEIDLAGERLAPVAFHPLKDVVAIGIGNTVRVRGLEASEPSLTLAGHTGDLQDIEFSHDGSRLLTTAGDDMVILWDTETGEELHVLILPQRWNFAYAGLTLGEQSQWVTLNGFNEVLWNAGRTTNNIGRKINRSILLRPVKPVTSPQN